MKLESYKYGKKNNWRRTMWNEIKNRLCIKTKDALVLYLAGISDLDRNVAISKGFKENNLIAIEKQKQIIKYLRNQKKLVIGCDAIDVLLNLSSKINIDVVFMDLCCGIYEKHKLYLRKLLTIQATKKSTIVFNFQRGREKKTNIIYSKFYKTMDLDKEYKENYVENEKHRGCMAIEYLIRWFASNAVKYHRAYKNKDVFKYELMQKDDMCDDLKWANCPKHIKEKLKISLKNAREKYIKSATYYDPRKPKESFDDKELYYHYMVIFIEKMKPKFFSYKSTAGNGLIFDSFVINNQGQFLEEEFIKYLDYSEKINLDNRVKNKIAAILAHRTRRLAA